jgi:hypothetical protein
MKSSPAEGDNPSCWVMANGAYIPARVLAHFRHVTYNRAIGPADEAGEGRRRALIGACGSTEWY